MWESKYEKEFEGITVKAVWDAWVDVSSWPKWDSEIEETVMKRPFAVGTQFSLKPKGGPKVSIRLTEVTPLRSFTDVTTFPFAKMYDFHEINETLNGVVLKSKITVSGPLAWLWRKIVAQGVASGVPMQMEALVSYAKKSKI
jgi:hypothetical protein